MQRRHAAACRLYVFFKRGLLSAAFEKARHPPAAPPGKRAQPALNGDFPHKGNPRTFLPQAKKARRGGKGAAPQGFEREGRGNRTEGTGRPLRRGKAPLLQDGQWQRGRGESISAFPTPPFVLREVHGVFEEIIFEGFPRPLR